MDHFVRRMRHYVNIGSAELDVLTRLPSRVEEFRVGQTIIELHEPINKLYVAIQGWSLRAHYLDDGRRQIINFQIPGDYFDLMSLVGARSDHSIIAATPVTFRVFDGQDFLRAVQSSPRLSSAFWWVTVQEETILRQQIVRVGRLNARERIANFILELSRRQSIAAGSHQNFVPLPVPQAYLADALGLSVVHVSRSLTSLKSKSLLETDRQGITIKDRQRLIDLAEYNSALFESHPVPLAEQ